MRITNLKGGPIEYEIDGEFFETNKKSLEIKLFNEKLTLLFQKVKILNFLKYKSSPIN